MNGRWKNTTDYGIALQDRKANVRFGECGICDQGGNSGSICRCDEVKSSSAPAGSTADLNDGVWFQSSASGGWYRNPAAAGDIYAVMVNGKKFTEWQRDLPLLGS